MVELLVIFIGLFIFQANIYYFVNCCLIKYMIMTIKQNLVYFFISDSAGKAQLLGTEGLSKDFP